MHDVKSKRLKPSDPLCYHTFWLFEILSQVRLSMIGYNHEMSPSPVTLEEFHGSHHCEQFFIDGTVALLASVEGF